MTPAVPQPLRVLGIDPGLADVGWGVIDWLPRERRGVAVGFGVIRTRSDSPLIDRLDLIHREVGKLISTHRPEAMAVEQLFFARNVTSALVVAHGRAACILAGAPGGVQLAEYTPLQIKLALTGHGRAGKEQVQKMVRVLLNLPEIPRPDHAADALAAALCHVHGMALREKVQTARNKLGESGKIEIDANEEIDPRKLLLMQSRSARRRR